MPIIDHKRRELEFLWPSVYSEEINRAQQLITPVCFLVFILTGKGQYSTGKLYCSTGKLNCTFKVFHGLTSIQAFIYNVVAGGVTGEKGVWGTEVPKRGPGAEPLWGSGGKAPRSYRLQLLCNQTVTATLGWCTLLEGVWIGSDEGGVIWSQGVNSPLVGSV